MSAVIMLVVGATLVTLALALAAGMNVGHRCPHDVDRGVWCHRCYGEPF